MEWSIPKRYLKLTLYDGRKTLSENAILSKLDITSKVEFNIFSTVSGASKEANITIGGLTMEKMAYLSSSFTVWSKQQIRNKIYIDAGYNNNHSLIFVGDIVDAVPQLDNANYTIRFKCLTNFGDMVNIIESYSFKGQVNILTILRNIANEHGYTLKTNITNTTYINNYSYSNTSIVQHLRNLSEITGLDIYIDGDKLIAKNKGGALKYPIYTINYKNMIGVLKPTQVGCNVKVRLDPTLQTGQRVKIQSVKFPQLNDSVFVVQTIGFKGDTRGVDWYNELTLIKEGLYEQ